MPRGPRLAFQNAFYHVFNRGINKQDIFLSEQDYLFFLNKLKDLKLKYDHSIYAFCLMPNHFHISIHTGKTPISKIMSSLATSYSMYFNNAHNHFGSVFQNRFKSILIESDSYFLKLSQYIYLNPVREGLVSDPLNYKFSSIREAFKKEPFNILDKDSVRLTGESESSLRVYKKFIYSGLENNLDEIGRLFEKEDVILGTSNFVVRSQRKYLRQKSRRR